MYRTLVRAFTSCLVASSALAAHGQFYKIHNADLGVNGVGLFTRTLTSDSVNAQNTTDTAGVVVSFREHPVSWAGVEFNYGYSKYSQVFTTPIGSANVKSYNHEATGAYLFHPHFRKLQPFVGIGGGAIDFVPQGNSGPNQWRGTGLLEVGLDVPTRNPHLGFRFQGRGLFYRAPNFNASALSSRAWIATIEPSGGVYFRF